MLDDRDRAILRTLQQDGRATNLDVAKRANLSESACFRRTRALEQAGVITGYTGRIDQRKVGLGLDVFLQVTLASQAETALAAFEEAAARVPQIMECYLMTGEADYLVRVVMPDIGAFEALHSNVITRLPGVVHVTSSIALRTAVRRAELPL